MKDARHALAEVLANELDLDLNEEVLAAVDKVLASLWLLGFKVVAVKEEDALNER